MKKNSRWTSTEVRSSQLGHKGSVGDGEALDSTPVALTNLVDLCSRSAFLFASSRRNVAIRRSCSAMDSEYRRTSALRLARREVSCWIEALPDSTSASLVASWAACPRRSHSASRDAAVSCCSSLIVVQRVSQSVRSRSRSVRAALQPHTSSTVSSADKRAT